MTEERFMRHLILKKLAELDYRIDKLKKMGMEAKRENLTSLNKDEYIADDVSSLFFLGRNI